MQEIITIFAETNFRNQKQRFGIKPVDRMRHTYIIGKTGTGKTTLLENMAVQDIKNGHGLAIIDPHGEFAEKMLDFVPKERIKDVIYFDPSDTNYPIAFNVMENIDPDYRHLIASGLMGVFKKIWPDVWSARMEYILNNTILALLEYSGSTLLSINRMLADKDYRKSVVDKITDSTIKSFWVNEFAKYPERFREEATAAIQNKIGQFISSPLIRNIVGQPKSTIDARDAMDQSKILLINLSKGRIGEDASSLLGALWISKLQLAAMSRVDTMESERRAFYLYVDEFQNFATDSFRSILSEARKYRLGLILTHQYIAQLEEQMRDAIIGNVGTIVLFRVGAPDAEYLEQEFGPEFTTNDLVNLGFANIYLKLLIDGFTSRPFSALTLPPIQKPEDNYKEKIKEVSRATYGNARKIVEDDIAGWNNLIDEKVNEEKESDKPGIETVCWECGKKTKVNFQPDGVRPIYCKDCLGKVRTTKEPVRENINKGRDSRQSRDYRGGQFSANSINSISSNVAKSANINNISLQDAFSKEPVGFTKKKRRDVDMSELKNTLKDAGIGNENN